LLSLFGAHHIFHASRLRVKLRCFAAVPENSLSLIADITEGLTVVGEGRYSSTHSGRKFKWAAAAPIGIMVIQGKGKDKKGKLPNTPCMLACTVVGEWRYSSAHS
jgi:hypothetical protein